MEILRLTARWTGFNGAPGYTNFHFAGGGGFISDVGQVATRTREALQNLSLALPSDVSISLTGEAQRLDSDTGLLEGYESFTPPSAVNGQVTGGYSAASGAVVNWSTGDVRFGRRIRGRTFIVPLGGSMYQDDGTLTPGALGMLRNFADEMTSFDLDSEFGVWSRPRNGSGGVFASVTGFNVPDMAAVLRSRRD